MDEKWESGKDVENKRKGEGKIAERKGEWMKSVTEGGWNGWTAGQKG